MAEMSMNKVIHGAFRRDLDRFVAALEGFPRRPGAGPPAGHRLGELRRPAHDAPRGRARDRLARARVRRRDRDLVVTMDAEHDVMAVALPEPGRP